MVIKLILRDINYYKIVMNHYNEHRKIISPHILSISKREFVSITPSVCQLKNTFGQ